MAPVTVLHPIRNLPKPNPISHPAYDSATRLITMAPEKARSAPRTADLCTNGVGATSPTSYTAEPPVIQLPSHPVTQCRCGQRRTPSAERSPGGEGSLSRRANTARKQQQGIVADGHGGSILSVLGADLARLGSRQSLFTIQPTEGQRAKGCRGKGGVSLHTTRPQTSTSSGCTVTMRHDGRWANSHASSWDAGSASHSIARTSGRLHPGKMCVAGVPTCGQLCLLAHDCPANLLVVAGPAH